jgi:PAS domain
MNINPSLQIPNLRQMVVKVISNSQPIDSEVAVDGHGTFQPKILPYRNPDGKPEGAVLTLMQTSKKPAAKESAAES